MKVVVSGPAKARLRSHLQFILEVFDEGLAERTLKEILDDIEYLGEHPRSGQFKPYLEHLGQGHRRWVVGHYKLVYLIEGNVLHVTDIFDSRQDPEQMHG